MVVVGSSPLITTKRVFAFLSCVSSILILSTFYIARKWQFEFKDAKQMLFALSGYTILASIGLFIVPTMSHGIVCNFQAVLIQFFGIGGAIYDAFLSLETKFQIDAILQGAPQKFDEFYFKPRHYWYHSVVVVYGLCVCTWMLTGDNIGMHYFSGVEACAVCWIRNEFILILVSLIPVWISLCTIIGCNIIIVYKVIRSTRGRDGQLVVKLTSRTQCMIIRMLGIPFFSILVWLPATVLRICDVYQIDLADQLGLDYLWLCTFASSGLFNGILYVAMDGFVLQAWKKFLLGKGIEGYYRSSAYGSTSDGTSTVRSYTSTVYSSKVSHSRQSERVDSTRDSSEINQINMVDILPANISRESLQRSYIRDSEASTTDERTSSVDVETGDTKSKGSKQGQQRDDVIDMRDSTTFHAPQVFDTPVENSASSDERGPVSRLSGWLTRFSSSSPIVAKPSDIRTSSIATTSTESSYFASRFFFRGNGIPSSTTVSVGTNRSNSGYIGEGSPSSSGGGVQQVGQLPTEPVDRLRVPDSKICTSQLQSSDSTTRAASKVEFTPQNIIGNPLQDLNSPTTLRASEIGIAYVLDDL